MGLGRRPRMRVKAEPVGPSRIYYLLFAKRQAGPIKHWSLWSKRDWNFSA